MFPLCIDAGAIVEVFGVTSPVEPLPRDADESFASLRLFDESGQPALDANGRRGKIIGFHEVDERLVVETFDGHLLPVPEDCLHHFEPESPELGTGGFDVLWPSDNEADIEVFSSTVASVLSEKNWCVVQTFTAADVKEAAWIASLDLIDWRLPKKELEVHCLGMQNVTKYAELDPDDGSNPHEDALVVHDRILTQLGLMLEPVIPSFLGFELWGRHAGQVRVPLGPMEESELRPPDLDDNDYEVGGQVYRHLDLVERQRLLALFSVATPGNDNIVNIFKRGVDGDEAVRLRLDPGQVLLMLPEKTSYAYHPGGERNLLLQTWYVAKPVVPDMADQDVVEIPVSQQGHRVHLTALQLRMSGSVTCAQEAWHMWSAGTDCTITLPTMRFDYDEYYSSDGSKVMYTNHFAGVDDSIVMGFDHQFFGISRAEAEALGPGQRNTLEVGYELLNVAGYNRQSLKNMPCGVYVGDGGTDWKVCHAMPDLVNGVQNGHEVKVGAYTGWQIGVGSSRLSHSLGLKGPCTSVDTACSSSLVALGQASRALSRSQKQHLAASADTKVDKAVVMGLCLDDGAATFVAYCAATMLSVTGRSFTFDESANGFLRGEGCGGVFVHYSDSGAHAQDMLACVVGCNVNQDGRSASMTAPHGPSQQMCIKASMEEAGLRASDITIAECHGTGTALGDPIEVGALREVMRNRGDDPIIMTSSKTNFGHMEACAGMGGLGKCIIMLNGMTGICNIHLHDLNPHIDDEGYPAYFVDEHTDCAARSGISGVSSFGVGGTNARVDIWGRCTQGYLRTAEVNTREEVDLRGVALARVARNKHPGPGAHDQLYITGTWGKWVLHEMRRDSQNEFSICVPLSDVRTDRFRFVLNQDWAQSIYPGHNLADDRCPAVGPDWNHQGRCWKLDGRPDEASPGDVYRVTFKWGFAWDTGEHKDVSWNYLGPPSLVSFADVRPRPSCFDVVGSWTSWHPASFQMVDSEHGLYQCSLRVGLTGREEFYVIRDGDFLQAIYPAGEIDPNSAGLVCGPDGNCQGRHWIVQGTTGEVVTIQVEVAATGLKVRICFPPKLPRTR